MVYPTNSTFKFCESVIFVDLQRNSDKWTPETFASDPIHWFEALRSESIRFVRIAYGPSGRKNVADRRLVGFVGGGGRWLIEAVGPTHSDFWEGRWQIGDRNRPDHKIWQVTYERVARGQQFSNAEPENLQELQQVLQETLGDIERFARSQRLDQFAQAFGSALSRLSSVPPYKDQVHNDLAPAGFLSIPARRLLAASQDAWVFGGMGSWNDVSFPAPDQFRYEDLSERLYQLLNRAIVAAANSSAS